MEKQAMRFLNLLGNKFFSVLFTWILNQRFKDTLCGTKALFKHDYEKICTGREYFGDFDPFGDSEKIPGFFSQSQDCSGRENRRAPLSAQWWVSSAQLVSAVPLGRHGILGRPSSSNHPFPGVQALSDVGKRVP